MAVRGVARAGSIYGGSERECPAQLVPQNRKVRPLEVVIIHLFWSTICKDSGLSLYMPDSVDRLASTILRRLFQSGY